MKLTRDLLQRLITRVAGTREREMDCGACFDELDRYAEHQLEGREIGEVVPALEQHLEQCPCCRDEYAALLDALRATRE